MLGKHGSSVCIPPRGPPSSLDSGDIFYNAYELGYGGHLATLAPAPITPEVPLTFNCSV